MAARADFYAGCSSTPGSVMHHASRNSSLTLVVALLLLVSAAPLAAALAGLWPGSPPLLAMAMAGLACAGMLFHQLLVRHLGAADLLGQVRQRWQEEQAARVAAETALADVHAALCGLVRQQEQVRDSERQRIARDIHDDLGQHLLALKIEVQLARQGTGAGAEALLHLAASIDHSIAALRTVIGNLRPAELQDGLAVALQHHLRECARIHRFDCCMDEGSEAALRGIDPDSETMLLRIVREALANALRHAHASRIVVSARRHAGALSVVISDNGVGMGMALDRAAAGHVAGGRPRERHRKAGNADNGSDGSGCGLAGIAERVAAVGGQFALDSGSERGTRVAITVPLPRG